MALPSWAPAEIDLSKPSAARVYDYYLGGSHNFEVDRNQADEAIRQWPDLPKIMQENRGVLRRAVRYCVSQGIRQFLDIGSGIPTVGNVHEVAQRADPSCRTAYVDIDSIAVAHSRAILADNRNTTVVQADMRYPDQILHDPDVRRLIDFDQPVAVLMLAVLHFVSDEDDPLDITRYYREAVVPGSMLAISHATFEGQPEKALRHSELYRRTGTPMWWRSKAEITAMFGEFELVDPGLVWFGRWRPDPEDEVHTDPQRATGYAGVGVKR
ncbi:SAM-dependent methyltransferase [Allokutzneria multivorans]|uniref:SAM-dependent methyltransferase n=1 Tax=Allokutzneria multivorans TaxID=1142134 RepID=A0ABP7RVK1_9PSEU